MPSRHKSQENQLKANQKRNAGEFEKTTGEKAYQASGWGLHGWCCMFDRAQSAVTGRAMTTEVDKIRKGERLTSEADQIEQEIQQRTNAIR